MKKLSETPRTDAQSQLDAKRYHGHSRDYVSLKIFTEQLERELNELKQRDVDEYSIHNANISRPIIAL